jgi:hypothetical protein
VSTPVGCIWINNITEYRVLQDANQDTTLTNTTDPETNLTRNVKFVQNLTNNTSNFTDANANSTSPNNITQAYPPVPDNIGDHVFYCNNPDTINAYTIVEWNFQLKIVNELLTQFGYVNLLDITVIYIDAEYNKVVEIGNIYSC